MVRGDARIRVRPDATIIDATEAAQALLGMTLEQLRALPPGGLSVDPERNRSAGFETQWAASGRAPIMGVGTAKLLDDRLIRVRYLITVLEDQTYEIILESSNEAVTEPPRTYTIGGVLSEWRSAERKLAEVVAGTREWADAQRDIEYFRAEYQRLARAHPDRHPAESRPS